MVLPFPPPFAVSLVMPVPAPISGLPFSVPVKVRVTSSRIGELCSFTICAFARNSLTTLSISSCESVGFG